MLRKPILALAADRTRKAQINLFAEIRRRGLIRSRFGNGICMRHRLTFL